MSKIVAKALAKLTWEERVALEWYHREMAAGETWLMRNRTRILIAGVALVVGLGLGHFI